MGIWKAENRNEMETGNGNWKWKLEMEIGNRNGNKKHTNQWCNVFFIMCLVITVVFYLAMVIWRALWVMCFAFTLVLCFVITYLVWLTVTHVACNVAIWSGSHVRGSGHETIWPWEQPTLFWNKASIPTLAASFLDPLLVLIVWSKLWLHTQALGIIAPFPTHTIHIQIPGHVQGIFIQNQLLTKYGKIECYWEHKRDPSEYITLQLGVAMAKNGDRERTGMPRNENQQHLNDYNS